MQVLLAARYWWLVINAWEMPFILGEKHTFKALYFQCVCLCMWWLFHLAALYTVELNWKFLENGCPEHYLADLFSCLQVFHDTRIWALWSKSCNCIVLTLKEKGRYSDSLLVISVENRMSPKRWSYQNLCLKKKKNQLIFTLNFISF